MKQAYKEINFRKKTRERLDVIEGITSEYLDKGFRLTVRQLFYQLVSRGMVKNTQNEYYKISDIASNGRLTGVLDWDCIEDRTRSERGNLHWDSPQEMLQVLADRYMTDTRWNQPVYVECWIEKDALVGVIEPIARAADITCFSCRGYPSVTTIREAAFRFKQEEHRQRRVILYAGDHDPSGMDIPRDITEKMKLFGADVEVVRIALTKEQIKRYNPPPNTAKEKDKRYRRYVEQYGKECWELDALEPQVLAELFEKHIMELTDVDLLYAAQQEDEWTRQQLRKINLD